MDRAQASRVSILYNYNLVVGSRLFADLCVTFQIPWNELNVVRTFDK